MRLLIRALLAVGICAVLLPASAARAAEYDECDADFIAFIGADAYQFSPLHEGELGTVRLFSIISYQRAAHEGRFGNALWQLQIDRAADGERVLTVDGRAFIGRDGAQVAEIYWDGRDDAGVLVPPGVYTYTFVARYVPDRPGRLRPVATSYDAVMEPQTEEALASSDNVVVNYSLTPRSSRDLRISANATSCQIQQNTPLEPGFGYNFYYGSTHSHSNWSDGGQPTSSCSSGNAYGSGTFDPSAVFNFARTEAGLDFWVVNEHNHLIENALGNNNPPITEAKVRQRYQDGLAAANAATVNGSFVGLYGMEWGVTSNADQGHVTLIETPALLGWETCTNCNGPDPECTPGTNCYFDVFTPKRYGYLQLYAASVANPSSAGPLGIFNHPGSSHFDGYALDANADDAIQGIAVRSGLAFSTATDCATTNVGATDYSVRWKSALDKGFHLGPVADHDSHCNNYGVALPTRTVYLAPSLTKADIMAAHRARRFYASEDPNLQLVFRTGDGAQVMGDIFNAAGGVTLVANAYDPDGETISTLEIWRGTIGGGVPSAPYATYSNQSSVTLNESLSSGTYWYYVHAVQSDGHDVWSSPMWITYGPGGGGGDTTPPTTSIAAPVTGATVSGTTVVTASASDDVGVTSVEFLLDGVVQASDTTAPYEWSWNTTASPNGSHSLTSRAWDAANNSGTSTTVSVMVDNGGGSPGAGADVSGWTVTQANATYNYAIPAGTVIPDDGYLVIARSADRAAFESFWGVTLPANAVFINSGGGIPVINGDETYTLSNAGGVVDGPTPAIAAGRSMQRQDPCTSVWDNLLSSAGTPGSGAGVGCNGGVKINEYSDASGTGNYIYEFIELHNDSGSTSGGDTTPPSTSITAPLNGAIVSAVAIVTASASDDVGVTRVEFWLDGVLASTDTTSPYEWSWDTLTAVNGTHSIVSKAYDAAENVGTSPAVNVTVDNDTTPPSTSITAPANGASVSGATLVTASATDNVGVTRVEFWLDGALASTDTTSPYEWSWDTTAAANGSHSLVSKAYDAKENVGTSASISVTVSNTSGTDVSNYRIVQTSASYTFYLPAGTTIPSQGYVIVGRNATRAAFEAFWGVTLGANVTYVNGADGMPVINGDEAYTLYDAAGTKIDGATVKMPASAGDSLQRTKPCGPPNKASSWSSVSASSATPGSGAPASCGKGIYISEFSDALGTGNYVYEFIEIYNEN